jgi:DNA-binding CsgD family transcriptional regulator
MELIDLGSGQPDDAARGAFLDQLCQRLELDFACFALQDPFSGKIHGYATYPDEWKRFYAENGFQRFDPTFVRAVRSVAPVDWARFDNDEGFDAIFGPARDFGISSQGLSVPVRGPMGDVGLLTVTRDCPQRDWQLLKQAVMGELQSAAVHFHDSVMSSNAVAALMRIPQLSLREREILQWVAAGKSQQDIGDILSISHRTVEVHIRSAREKLGALTTPQAVGRAVRMGLISPT